MVKLSGKPQHIGGKYYKYKINLVDETKMLGADMQKIGLNFDYVKDQWIDVDITKTGRFTVEPIGAIGYMEIVEKEGSQVDKLLKSNVDHMPPFEFSMTGPYGKLKYLGDGKFFK